ncbi:MAG: hypothetical protein D6824_04680 [Planctomycetota bacterium]|nr:MAG: hypothetical protein D6824_04680 [Planctomycetota bacterium]
MAATATLTASSSVAQQGVLPDEEPPAAFWRLLAVAPAEVDALLALRGGAALRTTQAGAMVERVASQLNVTKPLTEAWRSLARSLRLSPEEAFARLLGREAAFFVRVQGDEEGPAVEWALASLVRPEVAERLERALAGAPRLVVQGAPVLAIEAGRYWLARVLQTDRVLLVFVPAGQKELLRRTLKLARAAQRRREDAEDKKGAPAAHGQASFAQRLQLWRSELGEGRAILALRTPDGGWLAASLDATGQIARGRLLAVPPEPLGPLAGDMSDAGFANLAPGALTLVVERTSSVAQPGAAGVWTAPLTALWLGAVLHGQPALARRVVAARVYRIARREEGGVSAAVAIRLREAASAAPLVDAALAALAAESLDEQNVSPASLDFGGALPQSVRTLPVAWPPLALGRESATLSWRVALDEQAPAQAALTPGRGDGWWILADSAEAVEAMERALATAGARARQGPLRREPSSWLHFGLAKPAALLLALRDDGGRVGRAAFEAGLAVDKAQWRALRTSDGATLLSFEVRVAQREEGR